MSSDLKLIIGALRVKDLQECLERLGLKKTGSKSELQQRLLWIFHDSHVLLQQGYQPKDQSRVDAARRIVQDTYQRALGTRAIKPVHDSKEPNMYGAPYSYSYHNALDTASASPLLAALQQDELVANGRRPARVRCHCGHLKEKPPMVRCQGEQCGIQQHLSCVLPGSSTQPSTPFFCELCRAARSDPFWRVLNTDLLVPGLLRPTGKTQQVGNSMQSVQNIERSFTLSTEQHRLLKQDSSVKLQLFCIKLGDSVPFRCHWPLQAELRVNGLAYRVVSRPGHQKLGANQRDEPADISALVAQPGRPSKIHLSCADSGQFMMVLQLVQRRDVQAVRALMRPALAVADAVKRVQDQFHGEDEDLETVNTKLSLKCPFTGSRIRIPARFSEVHGLGVFDLEAFLSMAERSRKWQCPHSMRHSTVHSLQIDTFTQHILNHLRHQPDVAEVEVSPDGLWRPAGSQGPFVPITQPHTSCISAALNIKPEPKDADSEQEDGSDDELREAAEAMRAATAAPQKKRTRETEVIDLISSDEDEPPAKRPAVAPPPAVRPAAGAAQLAPHSQTQQQQQPNSAAVPAGNNKNSTTNQGSHTNKNSTQTGTGNQTNAAIANGPTADAPAPGHRRIPPIKLGNVARLARQFEQQAASQQQQSQVAASATTLTASAQQPVSQAPPPPPPHPPPIKFSIAKPTLPARNSLPVPAPPILQPPTLQPHSSAAQPPLLPSHSGVLPHRNLSVSQPPAVHSAYPVPTYGQLPPSSVSFTFNESGRLQHTRQGSSGQQQVSPLPGLPTIMPQPASTAPSPPFASFLHPTSAAAVQQNTYPQPLSGYYPQAGTQQVNGYVQHLPLPQDNAGDCEVTDEELAQFFSDFGGANSGDGTAVAKPPEPPSSAQRSPWKRLQQGARPSQGAQRNQDVIELLDSEED